MKKVLLYLCLAVGLLSCANEIDVNPVEDETSAGVPMTFNLTVSDGPATKVAKTAWAENDVIYVFFKGLGEKYLKLTYNGSSWDNASGGGTLLDTDLVDLSDKTLTAVYFPVAVDVTYASDKFSFTRGGKPVYNYYLYQTGAEYTLEGTTVSASLTLGKPEGFVQFHVSGIQDDVAGYTFGCTLVQPVACAAVATGGTVSESVLQAGARLSGVADSDGAVFGGRLTTSGSADYTFTLANDEKIYTLTRTGKTLEAGKMYNFPALSAADWSMQNASDLYVDLGLTSGLKWATCNLGATTEADYGNHFAWGELTPKSIYALTPYFDNPSGNGITFIKYATNKKRVLEPEDDAAYAAQGGQFRMPTDAEWKELMTSCTWTWKTTSDGYASDGYLVTGTNGNTIFLPAAGYRSGSVLYYDGSYGYYWSSSIYENDSPAARSMSFNNVGAGRSFYGRDAGYSVRPVSD